MEQQIVSGFNCNKENTHMFEQYVQQSGDCGRH